MGCGCSAQRRRVADHKAELLQTSPSTGEPPPSRAETPLVTSTSPYPIREQEQQHARSVVISTRISSVYPQSPAVPGAKNTSSGRCVAGLVDDERGQFSSDSDCSILALDDVRGARFGRVERGDNRLDVTMYGHRSGVEVKTADEGSVSSYDQEAAAGISRGSQPLRKFSLDPLPQSDHSTAAGQTLGREKSFKDITNFDDGPLRGNILVGSDNGDSSTSEVFRDPSVNVADTCISLPVPELPGTVLKSNAFGVSHALAKHVQRDPRKVEAAQTAPPAGDIIMSAISRDSDSTPPRQEARPALAAGASVLGASAAEDLSLVGKDDGRTVGEASSPEVGDWGISSALDSLLDADEEDFMESLLLDE